MTELLQISSVRNALSDLAGWQISDDEKAIRKSFQFNNFVEAFGFMTQVALIAERMDHHPEWFNVYRTLDVALSTHDASGITQKDLDLARAMEKLILE